MAIFSFKKKDTPLNSDEYEKLAKRITDCESELDKFTARFMSLRGLIHRKGFADPEEKDELENNKKSVFLPSEKGVGA